MATIAPVARPEIALPRTRPHVPVEQYARRIERVHAAMVEENLDFLVVYGDREYSGDLHHLTALDPRFEEAIAVFGTDGARHILLGNENIPLAPDPSLGFAVTLFQELSPQGQLRHRPVELEDVLRGFGMTSGARVGIAGGKRLTEGFVRDPETAFTVPAYLVDAIRRIVGHENAHNAVDIFLDLGRGLRTALDVDQIAEYEYAASICSVSVHQATLALRPGTNTSLLSDQLFSYGIESSTHRMVNLRERVLQGLPSPTDQVAQLGDAYQVAQGIRGALTCRSGMIAYSDGDLEPSARAVYRDLATAYFDTMVAWYESLEIGVTGGEVFEAADRARDSAQFDFSLNPGHLLDFEEWSASPFVAGDRTRIRPGMVMQGDIIPISASGAVVGMNIEDGLAIVDGELRKSLQDRYPEMWERVEARREYVKEHIGVTLDESVALFSNIPLWHAPYSLRPELALVK